MKRSTASLALLLAVAALIATSAAHATDDDASLNATYKSLMAKLDAAGQSRLRDAQRAWIAFRDKECAFRATGDACVAELTRARTQALDAALADAGTAPSSNAGAPPSSPKAGADAPCATSAGGAKAAKLVDECLQVSPATHPPCNAANACSLIVDEIARGCAMIDANAPAFCAEYAPGKR
jgi:hypothetical protein